MLQRQQLNSLSSFAPAAGSSPGSSSSSSGGKGACSQQAIASSCHGTSTTTASLLAAADGCETAHLSGLSFAAGSQLPGAKAGAAASQLEAARCNHTYQMVWLADCPEAARASRQPTSSSQAALLTAAQHHLVSFSSSGAPSRRLQLEAGQPPSVTAMALLAALQQSAVSRDKQVGFVPDAHDCVLSWCCCVARLRTAYPAFLIILYCHSRIKGCH